MSVVWLGTIPAALPEVTPRAWSPARRARTPPEWLAGSSPGTQGSSTTATPPVAFRAVSERRTHCGQPRRGLRQLCHRQRIGPYVRWAGRDNRGDVGYSYATGGVSGGVTGGLIGESRGVISASRAEGSVSGLSNVGGLAGFNAGPVTASYATGSVSSSGDAVGGLIGSIHSGPVTASYATGDVSGKKWVGGLVGNPYRNVRVSASYATGDVSGDESVGGLLGRNDPQRQ